MAYFILNKQLLQCYLISQYLNSINHYSHNYFKLLKRVSHYLKLLTFITMQNAFQFYAIILYCSDQTPQCYYFLLSSQL